MDFVRKTVADVKSVLSEGDGGLPIGTGGAVEDNCDRIIKDCESALEALEIKGTVEELDEPAMLPQLTADMRFCLLTKLIDLVTTYTGQWSEEIPTNDFDVCMKVLSIIGDGINGLMDGELARAVVSAEVLSREV